MKLAPVFSTGVVLQRGVPLPVWGTAEPKRRVTVSLAGQVKRTNSRADGRWLVRLDPLEAGGPFELAAECAGTTVAARDVLVGEVWFCSGQSNMEWPLGQASDAAEAVAAASQPRIRLLTVPRISKAEPTEALSACWETCAPGTAERFSAVAYHFGLELHRRLGVPVGLINSSWGGTRVEAWTSRESLLAESGLSASDLLLDQTPEDFEQAVLAYAGLYKAWRNRHLPKDPGNGGFAAGWADPATPTADWPQMQAPGSWQSKGLPFNAVVWFRREVDVPAAWAGRDLLLSLGPCDDCDTTYFNNVKVGATGEETDNCYAVAREYRIPAAHVRPGRNVVTVRIFDYYGNGGFMGTPSQMRLAPADGSGAEPIPLAGPWAYRVEHNFGVALPPPPPPRPVLLGDQNGPAALFNGMVYPLLPFAIRGAIWYQGESNAANAYAYRTLFAAMIRDWRKRWGLGDFPFLFVQLANYQARQPKPAESAWAELREAQSMALRLPNTAMAVTIDIGDAGDIHPKNKRDVGLRLAVAALAMTYGQENGEWSGPLYAGFSREGAAIRVRFSHTAGGLRSTDGGPLRGFSIAGADKVFVWADARAEGDSVLVSAPGVPEPAAVRYGWSENPDVSLTNGAALPASPFRTDDWPGITRP